MLGFQDIKRPLNCCSASGGSGSSGWLPVRPVPERTQLQEGPGQHINQQGQPQGSPQLRHGGHRHQGRLLPLLEVQEVPLLRRCPHQAQRRNGRQRWTSHHQEERRLNQPIKEGFRLPLPPPTGPHFIQSPPDMRLCHTDDHSMTLHTCNRYSFRALIKYCIQIQPESGRLGTLGSPENVLRS